MSVGLLGCFLACFFEAAGGIKLFQSGGRVRGGGLAGGDDAPEVRPSDANNTHRVRT